MKKPAVFVSAIVAGLLAVLAYSKPASTVSAASSSDALIEGFKHVEVASVSDALEQLYGQKSYMPHSMRPIGSARFVGPAVTVLLKKEEHHEGAKASQGMLDAIDTAPEGSVYVMVVEDGLDYAGIGGLMSTAMKARGFAGAVIDGSVRDVTQIQKIDFPVFSRGIAPSTTINHYRFAGSNIPVNCAGVHVEANDIVVADQDGVVVVPRAHAEEVLKKAQELDFTEHSMTPFIEKYKSLKEAVEKFGRI